MLQLDGIQPGDGVKAERFPGLIGTLTGSMMELQTLQEALKVEIQVHQKLVAQMKQDPQNADLKKQLHELQAKITALSEKQKKVVEQLRKDLLVKQEPEVKVQVLATDKHVLQIPSSTTLQALQQTTHTQALQQKTLTVTPVISTKTLPVVLKAATPTMPSSVVAQRPATVAMVAAISHASKPSIVNSNSQNTPVNLQVASKLTNQCFEPVRLVSKNALVVQATTTPTSAQPIKVPQFVPPPRLTPRPTFQPQRLWPITLQSTRRLRGRLTTCYASAARSQVDAWRERNMERKMQRKSKRRKQAEGEHTQEGSLCFHGVRLPQVPPLFTLELHSLVLK